jgi:hypothetical protein
LDVPKVEIVDTTSDLESGTGAVFEIDGELLKATVVG